MNNKIIIGVIVAVVAVAGVVIVSSSGNKDMSDMTSHSNDSGQNSQTEGSTSSDAVVETSNVTYKGFAVAPKSIKIKVGTTVTWTNEDSAKHDVTPDNESDDFKGSELFGKGETYQFTFNKAGTYSYICSPHPYMKGTIEVVE